MNGRLGMWVHENLRRHWKYDGAQVPIHDGPGDSRVSIYFGYKCRTCGKSFTWKVRSAR